MARRSAHRRVTIRPEPLAQLVEHRPFKPRVVGSIPTRLTLQRLGLVREIGRLASRECAHIVLNCRARLYAARMSGAEVLREIRRDPEISHTPVVLVSGQIQAFLAEVNELTFHSALAKPCEVKQLVGAVRSALSTEAVASGLEAICTKRPGT